MNANAADRFSSSSAAVNGVQLHYVRGGSGPPLVLIHGFPEDWHEYQDIMPRLTRRFNVIAVDLRGIGGSTSTPDGFDAANMAEDIYQLITQLRLEAVYVVGHDIGAMVAYALARRYPHAVRGAMLLDQVLPGLGGSDIVNGDPSVWHVRFMQVPGLAEKLVAGRQADYFQYFYNFGKFSPERIAQHLDAYSKPEQLHAIFEIYRAMPATAKWNLAQRDNTDVPFFVATGEKSPFAKLLPKIVDGLRSKGCTRVESGLISGAVHYVVDDAPDAVAELIEKHASQMPN